MDSSEAILVLLNDLPVFSIILRMRKPKWTQNSMLDFLNFFCSF